MHDNKKILAPITESKRNEYTQLSETMSLVVSRNVLRSSTSRFGIENELYMKEVVFRIFEKVL